MTAWIIDETENEHNYLQKYSNEIHVGDTIEVIPNNQLGYKKYKVILDEKGEKAIYVLADWFAELYEE
jgi:hypothetical protein